MAKKTTCPVTREQFNKKAQPVKVTIGGVEHVVAAREFATGSLGWYLNGKTTLEVDGVPVAVQIGLNLTLVGSKELPKDPNAAPPPAPAADAEPAAE